MRNIYSVREQEKIIDIILKERLDTVLKDAMEESGIDTWLILSKEYCEDPMFKLLTPASFLTARRVTILILHNDDGNVGKYCCNLSFEDLETIYTNVWTDKNLDQYEALNEFLIKINPNKIAVNVSDSYAYFDGLSHALYETLKTKLSKEVTDKFVSSEYLGVLYTEKRSKIEIDYFKEIMEVAKDIIEEAFSNKVITPGVTTTADVEYYMKSRVKELGLDYWFSPDVNLQNGNDDNPMQDKDTIINKGDLVHCDFGITYLNLNTDTQRLVYILKDDETEIPKDITEGYKENQRFQNIVRETFEVGKTGNEVFLKSLEKAEKEGIKAMLYTHPVGNFGHAPGPMVGLFSTQKPVYPSGELKLRDSTAYALELNTKHYVEQYGREIYFFTEESVLFKDGKLEFLSQPHEDVYKI